jgi:hypothetical protein
VVEVVREQVLVDRTASEAWSHLAHLEKWPSWAEHITLMEPNPPEDLTQVWQRER